jgi:hypothetical protein
MSNEPQIGQWFYEKQGRTWFIVHENIADNIYSVKEPATDSTIYLKLVKLVRTGVTAWRRCAREPGTGRFFVVTCTCGDFEFRGDDGPPMSRFARASSLRWV